MKKTFLIVGVYFLFLTFYGFHVFKEEQEQIPNNTLISVEISGAVVIPGLYQVSLDTTLGCLINYANGLLDNANLEYVDYDELVKNGKMYYIPFIEEKINQSLININTATLDELTKLTGVGKVKAEAIIEHRKNNGPFKTIEELMLVSGIGEKIYEQIKDKITV